MQHVLNASYWLYTRWQKVGFLGGLARTHTLYIYMCVYIYLFIHSCIYWKYLSSITITLFVYLYLCLYYIDICTCIYIIYYIILYIVICTFRGANASLQDWKPALPSKTCRQAQAWTAKGSCTAGSESLADQKSVWTLPYPRTQRSILVGVRSDSPTADLAPLRTPMHVQVHNHIIHMLCVCVRKYVPLVRNSFHDPYPENLTASQHIT